MAESLRRESMSVISVHNLSFRHASSEEFIIKNLSLEIGRGQFVILVGPSGSVTEALD
jgi:ABC-type bacteriocin/lantibiotic exporter with double-glycine peptidase domain